MPFAWGRAAAAQRDGRGDRAFDAGADRAGAEAIRAEINRALPERYQLISIATLPTPVDGSSARGTLTKNRYGIIQAVTGGLALVAGRFDASLDRPALAIAAQLADDLTDGVIDGKRLDGSLGLRGHPRRVQPPHVASDLVAAADALLDLFGRPVAAADHHRRNRCRWRFRQAICATLSVQAAGDGLTYQWFADDGGRCRRTSPTFSTNSARNLPRGGQRCGRHGHERFGHGHRESDRAGADDHETTGSR